MGSLMIEENVVAEAGTVHYLTLDEIRGAISELGYTPRQRNVLYELIDPCTKRGRLKRTMRAMSRFATRAKRATRWPFELRCERVAAGRAAVDRARRQHGMIACVCTTGS